MVNNKFKIVYKRNKSLVFIVAIACFFTNISQLPIFVSTGMTQKLNMPVWILLLLFIILKKRVRILYSTSKMFIVLGIIFVSIIFLSAVTYNSYFDSSILLSLIMSCFIYYLGTCVGDVFNDNDLKLVSLSYVLSATIVAITIYLEYFSVGFDITSRQYAYASKNSISQIIFTSVVILLFVRFERFKTLNFIKILIIIFEVMLLMILKSRATLVGFVICLVYIILGKNFNRKIKYFLTLILITTVFVLLMNENLFDTIVNSIIFAGRDASNLDSLTSGRISILSEFPSLIKNNWLTGIGSLYFECFPLSCILQFGIIVGMLIVGIAYLPIFKCFQFDKTNVFSSIFIVVCIGYGINSIFEGLAPIGPGVKCYYMWLMYGLLLAKGKKYLINKKI